VHTADVAVPLIRRGTPTWINGALGALVCASVFVGMSGPRWGVIALAVTLIDMVVVKRLVSRWMKGSTHPPGPLVTVLILVVSVGVPSAWLGCAVQIMTGSSTAGIACALVAGLALTLLMFVDEQRRLYLEARANPVPRKTRSIKSKRTENGRRKQPVR
jgi:hypothetical protein